MLLSEVDVIIMKSVGNLESAVLPFLEARRTFIVVPPHKLKEEQGRLTKLQAGMAYSNVFILPLTVNASSAIRILAAIQYIESVSDKISEKFILIENSAVCNNVNCGSMWPKKLLEHDDVYDIKPMLVQGVLSDDEYLPVLGIQQERMEAYITCTTKASGKRYRATGVFLICIDCLHNNLPLLIAATHKNGVHITPEPIKIYDLLHYLSNVGIPATLYSGEI